MNIEKLGITPIEIHQSDFEQQIFPTQWCYPSEVRELEQQWNEMLEALINECYWEDKEGKGANSDWVSIIEKADPQHRTWEEIKELIK